MRFVDYGSFPSNGPGWAFFPDGDDVCILGEGDTVQNNIRIIHIGNDTIKYVDVNTRKLNSSPSDIAPS